MFVVLARRVEIASAECSLHDHLREAHEVSESYASLALPELADRRLSIRLTKDALRQVRGGHPWVYAESISTVSDDQAAPGTLAVVFDDNRKFVAIGLWDPTSPIRLRVLHVGKPRQIDATFWASAVASAWDVRQPLLNSGTTGWRWINGENDGLGGLIVDRYDGTIVVKLYTSAWLPHFRSVLDAIVEKDAPERIVLRLGRNMQADVSSDLCDGMVIYGSAPSGEVEFTENGLRFGADVLRGQKTGHFLDQRDNRVFIGRQSNGADVLDVFCCTGGFTVHACAHDARSVHSVDISQPAMDAVEANLARNGFTSMPHRRSVGDAFEVLDALGQAEDSYDVVIVDPPAFATKASERDRAIRAYRKLTELALPLVRPGGRLFQASCSSRVTEDDLVATVRAAVVSHGRELEDTQVFGHALDHPVTFPQGRYLKAFTGNIR